MGVISKPVRKEVVGPECPAIYLSLIDKYRDLKFLRRLTKDNVLLYPRDAINWHDIIAYKQATGNVISFFEAELIMGIDGIFEGKEDG